ncbi:MAG: Clp protease ClpP [Prevotella sp.]|nr:Clp protease ClpP [Prevotella sp.]
MVPGDKECTIFIYGEIGECAEVKSSDIAQELIIANQKYEHVNIRINSIGGDVFTGLAIYNALKRCSKAHIYIDGVAASMASAIAMCGAPVEMSRHARLMIHSVKGGFYGTADEMESTVKEIRTLEETLCDMYARKCGMTADEFRAQYFDGEDHWLSARQALDMGFIDGIYDTDPVPENLTNEELYQTFNNRLDTKPQTILNMGLIDELRKDPQFKDCKDDAEILAKVGTLKSQAGGAAALAQENAALKRENQAFKEEKEAAFKAQKKQLLDDAEKCGRINASTRPAFEALLESDYEKGKAAIEALPATKRVIQDINRDQDGPDAWDKKQAEIREKYYNN